jgi:hypothetical protein
MKDIDVIEICSLIRLSKKTYYQEYFTHNITNMKKTWEGINEILYRRRKVFKTISSLKDLNNNGKVIKEASQIPHIINQNFATVGSKLAGKLPSSHHHYLGYVSKCKSPASSFYHQPVLPEDINLEILSIPNNKSYGLYSSPTNLFKCSRAIISPILSEIINTSIKSGIYPTKLKIAKIIPVYKGEDETDASNYRPISLL